MSPIITHARTQEHMYHTYRPQKKNKKIRHGESRGHEQNLASYQYDVLSSQPLRIAGDEPMLDCIHYKLTSMQKQSRNKCKLGTLLGLRKILQYCSGRKARVGIVCYCFPVWSILKRIGKQPSRSKWILLKVYSLGDYAPTCSREKW